MFERLLGFLTRRRTARPPPSPPPKAVAPAPAPAAVTAVETTPAPAPAQATPTPPPTEPLLLDVRTEREFATIALQGAVHVPLSQLEERIGELVADRRTPVLVYCASGARSGVACRVLQQMGFENVTNAGGLYAAAAKLHRPLR